MKTKQSVRPSRAIERGGGFYVPGLEGGKVRIAFALFLLALLGANYGFQLPMNQALATWLPGNGVVGLSSTFLLLILGIVDLIPQQQKILSARADQLSVLQQYSILDLGVVEDSEFHTIHAIAQGILSTSPSRSIDYVAVAKLALPESASTTIFAAPKPTQNRILYELASKNCNPTEFVCLDMKWLNQISNIKVLTTMSTSELKQLDATFFESLHNLPVNTKYVGCMVDPRNQLWILGSSAPTVDNLGNLVKNKAWIEALISANNVK